MKKVCFVLVMLFGVVLLSNGADVVVRAERQSGIYQKGEIIKFMISGPIENMYYTVDDGSAKTPEKKLETREISVTATKPGFVLVSLFNAKPEKGKRPKIIYGGAAVEPEKIVPGVKRPADFEKFWQNEVAEMRKHPLQVESVRINNEFIGDRYSAYDVKISRGDIVATGYLVIPAGAAKGSLPAVLDFNGASKVSAEMKSAVSVARNNNVICFNLNFHGLKNVNPDNNRNRAEENKLRPQVKRYQFVNGHDRQKYAMRKIFLRTVLVMDYFRTLPEFDGKNLVAAGGSLGGCQALVCAALVPEVVLCISNATAMCDHFGKDAGHHAGWPQLLRHNPAAASGAAYFDVVNFAPMVKCTVKMAVGFVDVICPPATTYAAYNMLGTADREMRHTVTGGHGPRVDRRETGVFSHYMKNIRQILQKNK